MKLLALAAILSASTALPARADPYLARCQMGECIHYDQSDRQIVGQGSAAVPGDLVRVTLRSAVSGSPDTPMAELDWEEPSPVQFFCSTARPAFMNGDASYTALDLVTPVGATTMITTMYLRACHPELTTIDDPFSAASSLGYRATTTDRFETFAALIRG
ncbi:hypothetical protein JJJ17_18585 [Paracoccus caeni]|uniref:Uncharacterized protein n=1 Tax=Paracoccus caeni TaxID=657651 RepID=A0A934SFI9_9RHOB|nr:hypothetical protein [Paracoccus caeni]MBK4217940.1 hypothetical protein [Paracoccus caeni]